MWDVGCEITEFKKYAPYCMSMNQRKILTEIYDFVEYPVPVVE